MGDFFILGNRVCIWKLNPAVLAPHKISLISHTSSRKNLLGPVARRDGGKLVHRSLCDSNDDTVNVSVSWTNTIECHCLKKNINNELCALYFPLALHCLPFCNMSPQIVNYLFCSCQRRQIFRPAPMLALLQCQRPNDSPHHVRPPASHIMLIVTYFFLFLPTAGESSALPPCCGHPTANVPMTLPVTFIIEGENLPQRTLKIDDNVASEDRRSRSTCCWMDRSRRSSLLTLCGIILILLLIVDAGVVSSIPRLAPFDALIIDEGGGSCQRASDDDARSHRSFSSFPSKPAALSSPWRTSTRISSTPEASDRHGQRRRSIPQLLCIRARASESVSD